MKAPSTLTENTYFDAVIIGGKIGVRLQWHFLNEKAYCNQQDRFELRVLQRLSFKCSSNPDTKQPYATQVALWLIDTQQKSFS